MLVYHFCKEYALNFYMGNVAFCLNNKADSHMIMQNLESFPTVNSKLKQSFR